MASNVQHVALCRPVWPKIVSYLHAFIVSPDGGRRYLEDLAYGAGKPGLNLDHVGRMPIALPPEEEATRIVRRVQELLAAGDAANRDRVLAMRRVHRLSQAVLKWAFEGKLVDQDPVDEPAEKLLERIRAARAAAGAAKARRVKRR